MAATLIPFRNGERVLLDLMKARLASYGFSHLKALNFGRGEPGKLELINFGATHGKSGEFCTSFGAGVRFESVERLVRPDRADELFFTVGKPLSMLKDGKHYPQWCFNGLAEPESIAGEIVSDIEKYAIPFLTRFSSLTAVRDSLLKPDPSEWFVLNPEQRVAVLVAIDHVEGRTIQALQLLDETLERLRDELPKKRWQLEQLRKRLVGAP